MRKTVIFWVSVVLVVAACVALPVGCESHSPFWTSTFVPVDFVYAGNRYICTGVVVANQDIGANTPSNVMYIGSTSYQIGEYNVYLIQGLDQNEAIALKIGRVGGSSYRKYERVYGQEEPTDFVYQGRDYGLTGEIIDIQRVVDAAAGPPEAVTYLGSVIYQGTTYDVYSFLRGDVNWEIATPDVNQEIAVRIAKAGKTFGFYYYYFVYERR